LGNAALGDTANGGSGGQVLIAVLIAWAIQTMVLIISLSPSVSCIAPSATNWYVFRKRIIYHTSQKSCFSNTKNDLEKILLYNLPQQGGGCRIRISFHTSYTGDNTGCKFARLVSNSL
jgi:hypothetical protein